MPLPEELKTIVGIELSYVNPRNKAKIKVISDDPTLGFDYLRWDPSKKEKNSDATPKRVSERSIKTICDLLNAGQVVHVDSALKAGGNSRSVLEAALAGTKHVWVRIVDGKKHLIAKKSAHEIGEVGYET